jgi:amidase
MEPRSFCLAMLGIGVASLFTLHLTFAANASFHLEEATVGDVQRAIRAKEITATELVNLYFKRIEAYNGTCVKGDADPTTGLMLGEI